MANVGSAGLKSIKWHNNYICPYSQSWGLNLDELLPKSETSAPEQMSKAPRMWPHLTRVHNLLLI